MNMGQNWTQEKYFSLRRDWLWKEPCYGQVEFGYEKSQSAIAFQLFSSLRIWGGSLKAWFLRGRECMTGWHSNNNCLTHWWWRQSREASSSQSSRSGGGVSGASNCSSTDNELVFPSPWGLAGALARKDDGTGQRWNRMLPLDVSDQLHILGQDGDPFSMDSTGGWWLQRDN